MADLKPLNFPQPTTPFNVNYDFTDLLETTGYVVFLGLDVTGGTYLMSRQALESTAAVSSVGGNSGSFERNFDYEFLTNQKVEGDLYVSLTYGINVPVAGSGTTNATVQVFHFDGTTETTIGTQQNVTQASRANPGETYRRETLKFDVNKFFKKGEKLRFEVIVTHSASNASSSSNLYHDAASRNFSKTDQFGIAASSTFKSVVPFPIDS